MTDSEVLAFIGEIVEDEAELEDYFKQKGIGPDHAQASAFVKIKRLLQGNTALLEPQR